MNRISFDPHTAMIGIAFISPAVSIGAGVVMNDIVATGALIWCIALSVITAMRKVS
jgi:hypothetical protein